MESEVIVWKDANENDYEVIALEWADRCQDQYRLDICLFPYSCSQSHLNELQGFQFRTFGVTSSGDGGYPKQAVTDLLPCSFYTYEISTSDQSFLFYNGSFQTTFSMEDFDLNLHDFSGEYGKYHTDTRQKLLLLLFYNFIIEYNLYMQL